jgi:hypothetical protein
MRKFFLTSIIVIALILIIPTSATNAEDLCVAVTSDFDFDDPQEFVDIFVYEGWNDFAISNNPTKSWWMEEASGGADNYYADYCELSFLGAHGFDGNNHELDETMIAFPGSYPSDWITDPDTVRMGYVSPDSFGCNIWNYISACRLLKDTSYPSWASILKGTHMLLGYKSDAYGVVPNYELEQMANRLFGLSGYSQESIQNAYFHTYVNAQHQLNICRILAENNTVASYDYIDSYTTQITVDGTYSVITCSY